MAEAPVSSSFTGTGTSTVVTCRNASISLVFAGTATVQLQRSFDGGTTWKDVVTKTATEDFEYSGEAIVKIRLNCTAHTDDVTYAIYPGQLYPGR